jgi:hypothetical protein
MRCLSHTESAAWCVKHRYPIIDANHYGRPAPVVRKQFEEIQLVYPANSGKMVFLASEVIRWFSVNGNAELLLWIDDWGVFPGCEHIPLFMRFRQALGESRALIEAPGHLLEVDELDDAVSVLAIALLFGWDCHVFSATHGPVFFVHMMSGILFSFHRIMIQHQF